MDIVVFPDVAHREATLGFTEYAYAVGAVQPDVRRTSRKHESHRVQQSGAQLPSAR